MQWGWVQQVTHLKFMTSYNFEDKYQRSLVKRDLVSRWGQQFRYGHKVGRGEFENKGGGRAYQANHHNYKEVFALTLTRETGRKNERSVSLSVSSTFTLSGVSISGEFSGLCVYLDCVICLVGLSLCGQSVQHVCLSPSLFYLINLSSWLVLSLPFAIPQRRGLQTL